ncbi:MAG: hypothetical protein IIW47_07025, partial [Bacteroidales bacterium]|nr:hypothetical protein [Bacteroidales bacterium]
MKRYFGFIFFASLLAIAAGCRNNNSSSMPQSGTIQNVADIPMENDTAKIAVNYAKGFKVNYLGNLKLVEISDPSANNP